MKNKKSIVISGVLIFLLGLSSFVAGTVPETYGNKVKAGEFVVEPPTLICLGFEWHIDGDDNRNATVDVHYRKKGDTAWKQAQPLLRLQREQAGGDATIQDYVIPNMFAGSILDLEPDTEYECKFQHERSGRRNWNQAENRVCTHTSRTETFCGRKDLARVSCRV